MQLTVPFLYTARLLKKQNRIEKDYPILGKATFEIPEISEKNAILVATAEGFCLNRNYTRGDPFLMKYYLSQKKHLVSRLQLNLDRSPLFKETNVTAENIQERLDEWARVATVKKKELNHEQLRLHPDQLTNPFVTHGESYRTGADYENNVTNVISWISDTREKTLAILTSALNKAICVDELVYSSSNGPFYRIDHRYEMATSYFCLSVAAEKGINQNSYSSTRLFDPLEHDAALVALRGRNLLNARLLVEEGKIDIFMPWVFERSSLYNNLYASVVKYAFDVSKNLPQLPPEIIHTFADTKTLIDRFKGLDLDDAEQALLLDQARILFNQHQNHLGRLNIPNDKNPLVAFFNANNKEEEDQGVVLTQDDFEEEGSSFKP